MELEFAVFEKLSLIFLLMRLLNPGRSTTVKKGLWKTG